jgi:hypothetical protein
MAKQSILLRAKHVNQQHKGELTVVFSWRKFNIIFPFRSKIFSSKMAQMTRFGRPAVQNPP